jgi:microcin C transport system permease protein
MGAYLSRRLLLMIPTLIGITFLVFMLLALSPGGIGEALAAAGGQMEASKRAQLEAYLEDRYGLDDHEIVQYLRWLGRMSPVKFGTRDQVTAGGELVRSPKALKPPPMWRWFASELPSPPTGVVSPVREDMTADQKATAYRAVEAEAATARTRLISAVTDLRGSLIRYADAAGLQGAATKDQKLRESALRGVSPDRSLPQWSDVERAGRAAIEAYRAAVEARARLQAAFAGRPFPQAGFPIIPGVISVAAPDMGVAFSKGRPVRQLIKDALPVTLLLNLTAFPLIYLVAIPGGMLAATKRGTWVDVGSGALFVGLWSIPPVVAGVLMLGFLAGSGWFPTSGLHDRAADAMAYLPRFTEAGAWERGYLLDVIWHIALPVACLVYGGFAVLSKQTRAAMLENFSADYVRTARAKGVPHKDVVLRHVFRNSLLPLITMFVTLFPAMLSGSVVIESIFTVPGMGSLILEAIHLRDRELILANTMMIAAVNLLALLLADVLYALADPRVSYG